jgi:DNA polymerase IV
MAIRKIIHLDLDAFFCAVEERLHPDLKGKPFAVGGRPDERGVVSSCSYPARQYGIHSAMPMSRALGLYPKLIVIPGHHPVYQEASEQVMEVLGRFSPLVEQISIDEAFLDVSDLPDPSLEIARGLQKEIGRETSLPCSLGVASNKLVAKMATDFGKASHRSGTYPNAIQVVPPGQEALFLAPLPTQALWGIGPKTAARLASMGMHTIGELAGLPDPVLKRLFGRLGTELGRHARGIDDRPVVVEHTVKSISQEITFDRDINNRSMLEDTLWTLAEQVGQRLRAEGYCGTTIRLKLRWSDFTTPTRQLTLNQSTDVDDVIYDVALELFKSLWEDGTPVRLLGVGVSGLGQRMFQLGLWDTQSAKERKLLGVMDELKKRFGEQAIQRGRNMNRRRGSK